MTILNQKASQKTPATESMIHVIGVGLSGADSLTPAALEKIGSATLLVGARRHLAAFEHLSVEAWPLGNFSEVFDQLRSRLQSNPTTQAIILATGDPLFYGIGRLLLSAFPPEQLTFYPQPSSIQLAFSRLKLPWQDATLVSVHGRDEQLLLAAIKRGDRKIAVLTDGVLTPSAIASLITALETPTRYRLWVCENLGSDDERLSDYSPDFLSQSLSKSDEPSWASLNVVVLLREAEPTSESPAPAAALLPLIGLPDSVFKGFRDRPTLMTKREIRLLILGELAPLAGQTIWDVGAGTGSVSVELSRLCPDARVYAIEKTAMGAALIRHNADRLAIAPVEVIQGLAPAALEGLPKPDRVFIGGSSGQLTPILDFATQQMAMPPEGELNERSVREGRIAIALATLEHLSEVTAWIAKPANAKLWRHQLTQVNIARSLPVGPLTRFLPLNPITLVTLILRSQ